MDAARKKRLKNRIGLVLIPAFLVVFLEKIETFMGRSFSR